MAYRMYDFGLSSSLPLPELCRVRGHLGSMSFSIEPGEPSSRADLKWIDAPRLPDGTATLRMSRHSGIILLRFPQLADFKVDLDRLTITAQTFPSIPLNTIRHLLLDQVIPRILTYSGRPVVHGSCVRIGRSCVGFVGETGAGKSTLGSFFHGQGFDLLCDDGFLVEPDEDGVAAIPGYPGVRLWSDSVSALSITQSTEPMAHYCSKMRILLGSGNEVGVPTRIPLRSIFLLDRNQAPTTDVALERITGAQAVVGVLRSTFTLDMSEPDDLSNHFRALAPIAANLDVFSLSYPRKYEELPKVLESVLDVLADSQGA